MNNKLTIKLIACVMAVLLLAGCVSPAEMAPPLPESTATPPPTTPAEDIEFTAKLFFLTSADSNMLQPEERTIVVQHGQNRAEAVLEALLQGPVDRALRSIISKEAKILYQRMELSGDTCLVYFTGDSPYEEPVMRAKAAIAATMQAAIGCRYTDLYLENVQIGSKNRPLGALESPGTNVNVITLQKPPVLSEDPSEMVVADNREAILYYSDRRQNLLCCAVKTIAYQNNTNISDILAMLLAALTEAPQGNAGYLPVLPADLTYKSSTFRRVSYDSFLSHGEDGVTIPEEEPTLFLEVTEWGRLSLYLETTQLNTIDQKKMCAAIVNTVTGFIPKIMSVRIFINGTPLLPEEILEQPKFRKDMSAFIREDFNGMLGHTVQLRFPDTNSMMLTNVLRIVPQDSVFDPRIYLYELLSGITEEDLPLFPLTREDILSVTIQGSLAVANMRAGFYDKLNELVSKSQPSVRQADQARLAVFSIVNTLCGVAGVQRVQLLEEGERIQKSLGSEEQLERVYLGNALFYNPGIMLPAY